MTYKSRAKMDKSSFDEVVDLCDSSSSSSTNQKLPSSRKLLLQGQQNREENSVICILSSEDEEEEFAVKVTSPVVKVIDREKRRMSTTPRHPRAKSTKSFDNCDSDDEDSIDLSSPGPFAATAKQRHNSEDLNDGGIHLKDERSIPYNLNKQSFDNRMTSPSSTDREKRRMSTTPRHPRANTTKSFDNCDSDGEDSIDLSSPGPFAATAKQLHNSDDLNDGGIHLKDERSIPCNLNKQSFDIGMTSSSSSSISDHSGVVMTVPFTSVSSSTIIAGNNNSNNSYNKGSSDDMMISTPLIPVLNSIGGKLYPDLRHAFIRTLITYAKQVRHAAAQRPVFDAAVRAVVILSVVREHPIRTSEACKRIRGIGTELLGVLKEAEGHYYWPPASKFSTVAPAVLVALLNRELKQSKQKLEVDSTISCSIEELIPLVNELLDSKKIVLNRPISEYLDKNNLDPEWGQIKKLCCENIHSGIRCLIKERRNKKKSPLHGIVYELTDDGRQIAIRLKADLSSNVTPSLGPLRQLPSKVVHRKYKSITMCVDFREGGGSSRSLHKICDYLDDYNVPYVVRELKIADYVFFVDNKIAPILIERKSAEDVAGSLADGRWTRQQNNMRKAQFVLGGGEARRCRICYLIEGDANKRVVHGGNVGRRSWDQTVQDVEEAIGTLPKLGFSVMRSSSCMSSIVKLAEVASEISWLYNNGSIDCLYTYDEFIRLWNACDGSKGDPPTLAEHKFPAPLVLDNDAFSQARISSTPPNKKNTKKNSPALAAEDINESGNSGELNKLSIAELKALCKERFEKATGTKTDLIAILSRPRKPELIITRMRHGQYVPKIPSSNAALMVALLLHCRPGSEGLTKESLMLYAEETGISKEPMTGTGGYYDGWSGMKKLTSGDPALVNDAKKRYSLTTKPTGLAGIDVANALHLVAHYEGLCRCGKLI